MLKLRRNLAPPPPPPDPTSKHCGFTHVRFMDVKLYGAFSYRTVQGSIMALRKDTEESAYYVQADGQCVWRAMAPETPVSTTEDQLHLHIQMKLRERRGEPTDNIPTRILPWR